MQLYCIYLFRLCNKKKNIVNRQIMNCKCCISRKAIIMYLSICFRLCIIMYSNKEYYFSYRAFGGQNKIFVFHDLCDKDGNNIIIARAILCDLKYWLFFGGCKNIFHPMLTILPSSSTRPILLASRAIYSCIPLEAIQYYINIVLQLQTSMCRITSLNY